MNGNFFLDLDPARRYDGRTVLESAAGAWSGADATRGIERMHRALLAAGARPGDRVAAQVEKSPHALLLYLASLRAGTVFLPLNTAYREEELAYLIGDARPSVFVIAPGLATAAAAAAGATGSSGTRMRTLDTDGGGSLLEGVDPQDPRPVPEPEPRAGDDLAALLYTSGTTGRPKGAMLTHENLRSNARALVECWSFDASDVLVHALPLFHVHGLFVACHCALLSGARLRWLPRFDPRAVIDALDGASVLMGVPTFYTRLLSVADFGADHCRDMRLFISGSAPLLESTFESFHARCGHRILERYGMSETGMLTSNPLRGERRAGTVGSALPGVRLRLTGDDGREAAPGESGHIEVSGPNVFPGYWQQEERTRESFTADGWFRTGDIGRFDADGYLAIVGRARDLVISGGYNVYPKEIEQVLDRLPGIQESAVIGLPDADLGEAVTAVIVAEDPAAPPAEADIVAALKARLAGYKVPRRVFQVAELPRNAMGKVQKNLLRERFGDD